MYIYIFCVFCAILHDSAAAEDKEQIRKPTAEDEASGTDKAALIERAMRRLDELKESNIFHNRDKMLFNEVKDVLRVIKKDVRRK